MVVGTVAAAAAAYAFQLLGGRVLGPTDFSPITLLWTIQFLAFSIVFVPMEQLTVRRLSLGQPGAAPWPLYLSVITATAVGATVFTALSLDRFFAGDPGYLPITAGLVLTYGVYEVGRGFLAGHRRFKEYGLVTLLESLLRLALAGAVISLGAGALGLGWTMVAGALVVWLWHPLRGQHTRRAGTPREAGEAGALATFITANAAAQTIVAAGPLVVAALGGTAAEVSIFFQTTLLLRAPLAVAYGLTSRVLPPFTRFV
jgi:O-antigen/teichoic acid export membrane protein